MMHKLSVVSLSILVVSFVCAPVTFARPEEGYLEFSPYAGILLGDAFGSATTDGVTFAFGDVDNAASFGGRLAYYLSGQFAAEVSLGFVPGTDVAGTASDATDSIPLALDSHQFHAHVNAVYHLPMETVVPYVTAGMGLVRFSGEASALGQSADVDENRFAMNFGGGVKWFLTDTFAVRVDARDIVTSVDHFETMHMVEVTAGVSWLF
jgi:OmpA-OmpF porin, OOP family